MNAQVTRISFLIVLSALLALPTYGQSLAERLARRIERAAEREAADKIGDALEDKFRTAMRNVYDMADSSGNSVRVEDDGTIIMTDGETGEEVEMEVEESREPANVTPSAWEGSFTIEVNEYKNGRLEKDYPVEITYHIGEYDLAFEVPTDDGTQSTMIMDRRSRKITTKMIDDDGTRSATVMPMLRVRARVQSEDVEAPEVSVTPTGNTKTIQGYACAEYRVETPDETGTMWVTEEWPFDYSVLFDWAQVQNASTGQMTNWSNRYGVEGAVLEAHMEEKDGNKSSDYLIKSISNGRSTEAFSLDGYEVNDISSMFGN